MDLAVYMVVSTCVVFFVGAAVALAWSVASGHWAALDTAVLAVFDDDDPAPDAVSGPGLNSHPKGA